MDSTKYLIIGSAVLFAANAAWLYFFSLTGFGFADAFDYNSFFNLLKPQIVLLLLVTGAAMAASIAAVLYFSARLQKIQNILMAATSGGGTVLASFFISKFSIIAVVMAAVFALACGILCFSKKGAPGGVFSKLGVGWQAAKKTVFIFSVGVFAASILFGYANSAAYSGKAKASLLNFTSNMLSGLDISGMISPETISDTCKSQISKQSIRELYETTMEEQWSALPTEQQQNLVDRAYAESMQKCNDPVYIQQTVAAMEKQVKSTANASQTSGLIGGLLESLPLMKLLFQLLPIFTALLILSGISLFGLVFVEPFTALYALFLPAAEKPEEKKQPGKQAEKSPAETKK